jgi:tripartite-type tricarboxylate transporter receptor subunit TctC
MRVRELLSDILRYAAIASLVTLAGTGAGQAAESYPTRPIRFVVGFTPGGAPDLSARAAARRMAESMKATIIVDNRPGAGGNIAADVVAKARPDGYTLFWVSLGPVAISPALGVNLPYDPLKDFAAVGQAVISCNALAVRPQLRVSSVSELVAMAKQRPGKLNYASQGIGSAGHLSGELFTSLTATQIVHVPYKGGNEAVHGLLGGEVELAFVSVTAASTVGSRAVPLGVTCAKRVPGLPDVPTLAEAGVKGYDATFWYGLLAPAGTPAPIIARLNQELRMAMSDPQVTQPLMSQGLMASPSSPSEFQETIRVDHEKCKKVLAKRQE